MLMLIEIIIISKINAKIIEIIKEIIVNLIINIAIANLLKIRLI